MFDMFSVTSHQEISERDKIEIKSDLGLTSHVISGTNYSCVEIFRRNGSHHFTLSSRPRTSFCKPYALQINPSRFDCHENISEIVCRLMGEEAEFNRIDFCYDLPLPLSYIEARLRVRNKIKQSEFESKARLTGLYFGSPKYELIAVYDRGFLLEKNLRKQRRINGAKLEQQTRIEIRKKTSKLPYKSFKDAPLYIGYNPFEKVEILDFEDEANLRAIHRGKAKFFTQHCSEVGFNMAYKIWNSSNNFAKTIDRYVATSELNQQMKWGHRKSLIKYFGVEHEK